MTLRTSTSGITAPEDYHVDDRRVLEKCKDVTVTGMVMTLAVVVT